MRGRGAGGRVWINKYTISNSENVYSKREYLFSSPGTSPVQFPLPLLLLAPLPLTQIHSSCCPSENEQVSQACQLNSAQQVTIRVGPNPYIKAEKDPPNRKKSQTPPTHTLTLLGAPQKHQVNNQNRHTEKVAQTHFCSIIVASVSMSPYDPCSADSVGPFTCGALDPSGSYDPSFPLLWSP